MNYPSQDDVLNALIGIKIPGTEQNIVHAGLVSSLSAKEEEGGLHVRVILEVEPEQASLMEKVPDEVQELLESFEGIAHAFVILSSHKKAPSRESKHPHKGEEKRLPEGVKHVIAVASGKGGVGKSTIAVSMAISLAKKGLKVGLLDVDVYGPSVPRLVGVSNAKIVNEDGALQPAKAHGLSLMSIGFLVDERAPMIWRGPMVHSAIRQMLYEVSWGELDVLVLDMPPGTGDAALSVAQQVPLAGAVIVSTPQDIALLDVRKGISMFERVHVPILGMIENMSTFECPYCHNVSNLFGSGGAEAEAKELGLDFLGKLPLLLDIRESSDQGNPLVDSDKPSEVSRIFSEIAEKIKVKLEN